MVSNTNFVADPLVMAEFDAAGLARALRDRRRKLGLSTRQLAQLAGLSQAYIVALERAAWPQIGDGPTPTVEVVARLAWALRCEPTVLFCASLRYPARHVLHVIDTPHRRLSLGNTRDTATAPVDEWIETIRLHRGRESTYRPERVVAALRRELGSWNDSRPGELVGRRLGLVFDEMSELMATVSDPAAVIAFESEWAHSVVAAVEAIGARVAWNICVYELSALRRLAFPVEAAQSLLHSHDTVWFSHARGRATGDVAARRLLRSVA